MTELIKLKREFQSMTFRLNNQEFAIPADCILEIVSPKTLMLMSKEPSSLEKIINLRGENIPIINISRVIHSNPNNISKDLDKLIMILNIKGEKIGILVDKITEIIYLKREKIRLPLDNLKDIGKYLYGVINFNNNPLFLLNPDALANAVTAYTR